MSSHTSNNGTVSGTSTISQLPNLSITNKSRFPRLQECAHFHYEVSTVDIPKNFEVIMCYESDVVDSNMTTSSTSNSTPTSSSSVPKPNVTSSVGSNSNTNCLSNTLNNSSGPDSSNIWFHLQVTSNDKKWIINRTYENFRYLDKFLHDCIFDRKFSGLEEPTLNGLGTINNNEMTSSIISTISNLSTASSSKKTNSSKNSELVKQLRNTLAIYLTRFCEIAFINPINCGPILNWFEIDNKGNRLFAIDDSPINIPGVAAAVVKKRFVAQGLDEICLDVGNMISVIDMPPADESFWWRGKKELEVGFFPADCVELIKCNQHLSSNVTEHLPKFPGQNQSVRLKHGKLITILRSFFNTRPARNHLQSKGILKQRVFACDLGEHLSNTQQEVPKILKICTEFIEKHGTVDGIYRHTGLQSNIQKLRNAFDEEKWNEIEQEIYINDVHSVSSLLKMYFRELPNPLLTYQLYNKFIRSVNVEDKIIEIHDVVQQLPPPHYRTLAFLMRHLHNLAEFSPETNMNTKNLAIVWAPNLLKSKEMDSKEYDTNDMLHSITLQANISEFLIANADTIFNDKFASLVRKQDVKNNITKTYRPISVCGGNGAKLLSLEEAQDKYKQVGPAEIPKYHTVIEIPELKKKKGKDKDKDKKSANTNNNITNGTNNNNINNQVSFTNINSNLPTNVQIQQQFENLQQQSNNSNQITNSFSSHSIIAASSSLTTTTTTPPVNIPLPSNNQTANQASSAGVQPGSSSPAFKSLLRNLRVGSFKHQTSPSIQENSSLTSRQLNLSPNTINESEILTNRHTPNSNIGSPIISNPIHNNLSRTASTSSTTTFKPVANVGIISPTNDIKNDYSNCISQLQSAAAQAMGHMNHSNNTPVTSFSSFSGTLSPPGNSTVIASTNLNNPAPILLRANKLNQSQNSIHSNILQNNPQCLSTFKDSNSSSVNLAHSDNRKSEQNPIPSKRKTIQPISSSQPHQVLTNSNSSTNVCSKSQQHQLADKNSEIPIINTSEQTQIDNKENQIIPVICPEKNSLRKSIANNEDDMQRLVAYMNQFEKENISNAAVTNQHHSSLMSINQSHQQVTSTQQQPNQNTDDKSMGNSVVDLPSIEEPSKLRLSSSSLSSYGDSLSNENNFEDNSNQAESKTFESTGTIQISSNESNPMIVTTQNLNGLFANTNSRPHEIDRRTYIVNKIYDNLDENDCENASDKTKNKRISDNLNEDDQYEKVILRHKDKDEKIEEDLASKREDNNKSTQIKENTFISGEVSTKKIEPYEHKNEHIYVNVNTNFIQIKNNTSDKACITTPKEFELNDTRKTSLIRESTGFDVTNTLKQLNHYENSHLFQLEILDKKNSNIPTEEGIVKNHEEQNSSNHKVDSENFDANFDTELVELNSQIEKLLTKNSDDIIKNEPPKEENKVAEIVNREVRTKSEGDNQKPANLESVDSSPTRRMTISSIKFENSSVIVTNNSNFKQPEKPPVTLRSKSIATNGKQNSISKSVSNDEIQQRLISNSEPSNKSTENRTSYRSKVESKILNEEAFDPSNDTNIKRKSALSSDEFKRRKPDYNQIESDVKNQKKTPTIGTAFPKNRQSLSTNTTPVIENDASFNLKNFNKKSMSKSLQDNSKLSNQRQADSYDQRQNISNTTGGEKSSVKTKIKLMESIVKSSSNERSSSSSSGSSSRSPPRSPKTIIEIVTVQNLLDKQKPPPVVTARTNINQPQNISKQPKPESVEINSNNKSLVASEPLKTSSNESLGEVSVKENLIYDTSGKTTIHSNVGANLKEKRHTVKELMSKFEAK